MPFAGTFGQKLLTVDFDIKKEAIENYSKKVDINGEVDDAGFEAAKYLSFMTEVKNLKAADFMILAVHTY